MSFLCLDSSAPSKPRPKLAPLSVDVLTKLHSRLQAASYTVGGQDWGKLFSILDRDHSGNKYTQPSPTENTQNLWAHRRG